MDQQTINEREAREAFTRRKPKMKSRPILFSAPMVRASLDRSKTQTRRIVKDRIAEEHNKCCRGTTLSRCPYGQPGDELWVRETWAPHDQETIESKDRSMIYYRTDDETRYESDGPWKPSIFMPRWASRITLTITDVRVERLQDISEEDAVAEGIYQFRGSLAGMREVNTWDGRNYFYDPETRAGITEYRALWESINGPDSWEANPFVWVISFERKK